MKQISVFLISIGLFTIQSCSNEHKTEAIEKALTISVSGKVYGLRSDTIVCGQVLPCNTYLPRLLFLNDSLFIKIIPADCGDIGKDFTCTRTYSGIYKVNEKTLTLSFHPNMVVHYLKSKDDANNGKMIVTRHAEREKSDVTLESMQRVNCKSTPYFIPCEVQGHFMTPTSDTLTNHIQYLKSEAIWENLFKAN